MYFYYFMLKKYRDNYQQLKCILIFLLMELPVLFITPVLKIHSSFLFHASLFFLGFSTWTFIEYILHRFYWHSKNACSSIAKTHHYHHSHPTELVVTPAHRVAMTVVLVLVWLLALCFNNYFTWIAGFVSGLISFFLMHKLLHLKIGQKIFRRLVRYHIYHHCKYHNTCYGVTVPWWDDLFKTVPQHPRIGQRIIDFYYDRHQERGVVKRN